MILNSKTPLRKILTIMYYVMIMVQCQPVFCGTQPKSLLGVNF